MFDLQPLWFHGIWVTSGSCDRLRCSPHTLSLRHLSQQLHQGSVCHQADADSLSIKHGSLSGAHPHYLCPSHTVSGAPKPCYGTMEKHTLEREKLYDRVPLPGDKIPSNTQRPPMNDEHQADEKVRRVAKRSHNGRSGGASK